MLVRFTDSVASSEGWSYGRGRKVTVGSAFTEHEIPSEMAQRWLESGLVEAVSEAPERASAKPGEHATATRTHGKRR